jgi:hypothetical protein
LQCVRQLRLQIRSETGIAQGTRFAHREHSSIDRRAIGDTLTDIHLLSRSNVKLPA